VGHSIGLLTPYPWTTPSEVNDQVAGLAQRLADRGHRVTVIAPSADRAAVREARARVQAVLLGERETVFLPDEASPRYFFAGRTYVDSRRPRPVFTAPADLIANIDVLLEADDLDVLHLYEPFAPSVGWAALRHTACPLVATFLSEDERFVQDLMPRSRQQRLFDSLDVAVAGCATVRDATAREFPGAYRIIPPGVDVGALRPRAARRPGPVRVVFAASQSRRQGLGLLLRALRRLDDVAEELELHVCGHDAQESRFGHRVPGALAERVTFHGRLSRDAMEEVLRDADVLCAPSLGPESAGFVLLEAMAAGTAIIASDVPGHREAVGDGHEGLLVPVRDAAALAAAWAARGVAVRPARPDWPVLAVDGSLRDIDGELDAGLCYPQDLWSFAISRLVPERPYRAVADLCAAPGGKSFALSLRFPEAHVAAMDSHPARLAVLACRAAALGLDRIAVVVGDAAAPPLPAAGFDLVLVDAPCSGTGTLQRNPDLRWKLKEEDILRLSRLQRPILAAAAGLVAPGGILVYATCSAEPEENEAVVDEFLERAAGAFRPLPPDAAETQFITRDGYFRTFPVATEGEGFFAAVMERRDTDCGPSDQPVSTDGKSVPT